MNLIGKTIAHIDTSAHEVYMLFTDGSCIRIAIEEQQDDTESYSTLDISVVNRERK